MSSEQPLRKKELVFVEHPSDDLFCQAVSIQEILLPYTYRYSDGNVTSQTGQDKTRYQVNEAILRWYL